MAGGTQPSCALGCSMAVDRPGRLGRSAVAGLILAGAPTMAGRSLGRGLGRGGGARSSQVAGRRTGEELEPDDLGAVDLG
jgi:hypothetical protein